MKPVFPAIIAMLLPSFGIAADFEAPSVGIVVATPEYAEKVLQKAKVPKPPQGGCFVIGVLPNSPAAIAGLKPYDVITKVGETSVESGGQFKEVVAKLTLGKSVRLSVDRAANLNARTSWHSSSIEVEPKRYLEVLPQAVHGDHDNVSGIVRYYLSPIDLTPTRHRQTTILPYVSVFRGKPYPQLRVVHTSDDWFQAHTILFAAGGTNEEVRLTSRATDSAEGRVWEWYDMNLVPQLKNLLRASIDGEGGLALFANGGKEHVHIITDTELLALKIAFDLEEFLSLPEEKRPSISIEQRSKSAGDDEPLRTWSDKTGKFSVKARFGGLLHDVVTLVRDDGKEIKVELNELSKDDEEYIRGLNE